MVQSYCILIESPSGAEVAINPNQVLFVRGLADMTCEIVFDDDLTVVVSGTAEAVVDKLHRATT